MQPPDYNPERDPRREEVPPTQGGGFDAAPGAIEGDSEEPRAAAPAEPPPAPEAPRPAAQPTPPPAPERRGPAPPPGYGAPPGYQAPPPQGARPPVYGAAPTPPPQQQQRPPYGAPPPGYGAPPPGMQQGRPPYPPPGPSQGGWGGGYQPPPPQRRSRVLPVVVGLAILFVVVIMGIAGLVSGTVGSSSMGGSSFSFMGPQIGVLEIEGVIGEGTAYNANTKALIQQVKAWTESSNVKGIVVRVNSPGGAVSATQELYEALLEFRSGTDSQPGRPIVVSMGDIAASGGYYAAMAADKVFANEGTLTGSVGVIMSFLDYQGLQGKIGITSRVVKSGEFKDIGSGSRPMTEEERQLLTDVVVDVYDQFLIAVVDGREQRVKQLLNPTNPDAVTRAEVEAHLRSYCDGRIFSGRQALEYGMIDEVGTLDDAIEAAAILAGVPDPENVNTTIGPPKRQPGLFGLNDIAAKIESNIPDALKQSGVHLEYRLAF